MLTREFFKPYFVTFLVELERIMDESNFVTANILHSHLITHLVNTNKLYCKV